MKRRLTAILLTTILLLLSACGQTENGPVSSTPETSVSESRPAKKPDAQSGKEVVISELYDKDGTATDQESTEYDYSYHVPQIEDDTPDAAYINDEIKAMYGSLADEGLLAVEAKEFPDFPVVDYEVYRSGPVLSLVIRTVYFYAHVEEYDTYIYDTEQGIQLFNDDLLAQKGMSEEQFLTEVRRAVVRASNKPEYASWRDNVCIICS